MLIDKGRSTKKKKKKTHIHNIFTFSVLESSRKQGGGPSEDASFQVFTYRHFRYELVTLLDHNLKHLLLYTWSEEIRNNQKPSDYSTKIPGLLSHPMSTHSCLCHDLILQNPQLPQLLLELLSIAADARIMLWREKPLAFLTSEAALFVIWHRSLLQSCESIPLRRWPSLCSDINQEGEWIQEKHKLN